MSDHIQVTTSELVSAASQFNSQAANLEQMLQQIQSQIESLRSTWQGQASGNFDALMAQWSTDVQSIHQVLFEVSQHLNQAAGIYSDTEAGIARGFMPQ